MHCCYVIVTLLLLRFCCYVIAMHLSNERKSCTHQVLCRFILIFSGRGYFPPGHFPPRRSFLPRHFPLGYFLSGHFTLNTT